MHHSCTGSSKLPPLDSQLGSQSTNSRQIPGPGKISLFDVNVMLIIAIVEMPVFHLRERGVWQG